MKHKLVFKGSSDRKEKEHVELCGLKVLPLDVITSRHSCTPFFIHMILPRCQR